MKQSLAFGKPAGIQPQFWGACWSRPVEKDECDTVGVLGTFGDYLVAGELKDQARQAGSLRRMARQLTARTLVQAATLKVPSRP